MYSVVVKFCSALCIVTRIKIRFVGLVLYTVMGYNFRFSYYPFLIPYSSSVQKKKRLPGSSSLHFPVVNMKMQAKMYIKESEISGYHQRSGLVVVHRGVWKGSKELVDLYHVLKLRIRESDWLKPVFYKLLENDCTPLPDVL